VRQIAPIINSKGTNSAVVINTVDPGLYHSELARELGFSITMQKFLLPRSAEDGSRNYLIAASLGNEGNGQYISYGHIARSVIFCPSVLFYLQC